MKYVVVMLFILLLSFSPAPASVHQSAQADNEFCGIRNTSFISGEALNYHVYYTLAGIYVYGGEANFNISLERYGNKPVYHIDATGKTNSFFDGFFKVRDHYESYIDTATLKPYRFVRNILEGDFKKFETVTFNDAANTATSQGGTFKVPECIQDVLSAIYYSRNIDFNKYKPGAKIPFNMFIDDKVYPLYIRYMGKEKIKTKYGKFNAIRFKPMLIEGSVFSGGEKMNVWVSDDATRIPVRIETPISVGSVKVDMMGYRNTRYKLTGLIDQR